MGAATWAAGLPVATARCLRPREDCGSPPGTSAELARCFGNGTLNGVRILSPGSVDLLLAPHWRFNGVNGDTQGGSSCSYGLASHQLATQT